MKVVNIIATVVTMIKNGWSRCAGIYRIYTAKAKEGRYVFKNAPFGYRKVGERKERKLVVEEAEAKVVRFIYEAYLKAVPLYIIKEQAKNIGFTVKGTTAVEKLLVNPTYAGLLQVEKFKDYPGGLFPGIHEPIVDITTWKLVQEKMKRPAKTRAVIDHEIPLRGVLKCHCGNPLSGAASRGKAGKYFYYYKCRHSKHNNISATKAHEQLMGACSLMSLPMSRVDEIKAECRTSVQQEVKNNHKKVIEKQKQLADTEEKLFTVEEKWIRNEISKDTYDRWYGNYNDHILTLKGAIERLSDDHSIAYKILEKNMDYLTDMRYVYSQADTMQKREFIHLVFDTNLYYQNGIYRTPTMMDIFAHNHLEMKKKEYLIYEKKGGFRDEIPPSRE